MICSGITGCLEQVEGWFSHHSILSINWCVALKSRLASRLAVLLSSSGYAFLRSCVAQHGAEPASAVAEGLLLSS
jgi:hypothetical protein